MSIIIIETALGRFRKVAGPEVEFIDRWTFECPGCGAYAYLDEDQWYGRVSVDHISETCTYHETHNYLSELDKVLNSPKSWKGSDV